LSDQTFREKKSQQEKTEAEPGRECTGQPSLPKKEPEEAEAYEAQEHEVEISDHSIPNLSR
jgi:hypothetical protein